MRIEGAGGCFDDRIYDVDRDLCWKIVKLSVQETGYTIDDVDEELNNFPAQISINIIDTVIKATASTFYSHKQNLHKITATIIP